MFNKNTLNKLSRFDYEKPAVHGFACTYILPKGQTVSMDNAHIINEPIDSGDLDTLCGTVYVGVNNNELIRSVQYICEIRRLELKLLQNGR